MKRLLTCLFLVLGLGLVLSVNVEAKMYHCVLANLDELTDEQYKDNSIQKFFISNRRAGSSFWAGFDFKMKKSTGCNHPDYKYKVVQENEYDQLWKKHLIKVAKLEKEPTQTIKLIITAAVFHPEYYDLNLFAQVEDSIKIKKNAFKAKLREYHYNFLSLNFKKVISRCEEKNKTFKEGICKVTNIKYFYLDDPSKNLNITNKDGIEFKNIEVTWNGIINQATLIAKKKPKKKVVWEAYAKIVSNLGHDTLAPSTSFKKSSKIKFNSKDQYNLFIKVINETMKKCEINRKKSYKIVKDGKCLISLINYYEPNDPSKNSKLVNKSGININEIKIGWDGIKNKDTLIAKNEPKKKEKKVVKKEKKKEKKKVVKVVEQEQEEFKPKKKDIDNDPPVIQIAEAITVDSQAYTLEGKVKDKSKGIYLTIDGRPVEVKRGKFTLDRFNFDPEIVEEIKIVAIDKWNNKSEKIVKVTVKLKATEVVRVYEDLKPNKVKVSKDDNKIAIIIGIEKYENLTNIDAKFANNDAKAFRAYAERALGVKSSNVKILIGKKATRSQTLKAFKLWLPKIAGEGKDIYIFFAGHGLASDNGKDLYILPQDGESSLLEDTAISRVQLISLIQKVNPKSVTMFFDTCYSGQTRGEQMLVASLRPIRIVAGEQDTPNNFTIFSASDFDQTSGSIEEIKHGMFSYYLMKGLEGKADANKNDQITNGELIAYLKTNVGKEAFTQNREQDPMLSGDPNQVLMKY